MFGVVGQLLLGWLLADFIGGLFHWWEDRVGNTSMPILGRYIVIPNRLHHSNPRSGVASWYTRIIVGLISLPITAAYLVLFGFDAMIAGMVLGAALVNDVHGWAHEPEKAPRAVRLLQDTGIFQSPNHHAGHHRGAHDRRYCILTNIVNPWLDAAHFWDVLEWGLARVGLEPNRGTQ